MSLVHTFGCNSHLQSKTLFSQNLTTLRLPLSLCPQGAISGLRNKQKTLFISAICALNEFTSPPAIPRHLQQQPVMAAGLRDAMLPIESRPLRVHSAWRPTSWSCVIAPPHVRACVRAHGFAATAPLSPVPFHSYKPRSVFIDAVYFVLYQINNKTQTQPEEQRRKVVHSWVGPIYIRSALSALCAWPCMFTIMHLRNNNRNKLTNKRS